MAKHIVIDGNAFYEVDEECLQRMGRGEQRACGYRGTKLQRRDARQTEKRDTEIPYTEM